MARPKPMERQKAREAMSRADSLESIQKYGKVIEPKAQPKPKKQGMMGKLIGALGGKK